jgi:fatty acid amide hydrolase 2
MSDIFQVSGIELSKKIRQKVISSQELVEAYIEKIESVNPALNAVVAERFDEARKEARRADEQLAHSDPDSLPVFLGVPCSVKECFALSGMPNSAGLYSRKDLIATQDAIVVERLRCAGAIPLGVTNTSELCMWMESNNKVYGRTNNPYNFGHTVGGSSGGEGAIIGAGASPFGIGSDIGGSIRMPAFFNGIFGHKPSSCLVPNSGQYPAAENQAQKYLCTGPLARRAEDLMPLMRIFAGPSLKDPTCIQMPLGDPLAVKIEDLTILNVVDNGRLQVADDLKQSQRKALACLERAGATIRDVRIRGLKNSLGIWSAMMSEAADTPYEEHLKDGGVFSLPKEILRMALQRSRFTLPSLGLVVAEKLTARFEKQSKSLIRAGEQLHAEVTELLKPNTLMLFPSYTRVAPPHKQPLRLPIQWQYTAIINVLELPATQVPLGLNRDKLPLGTQVIGGYGCDHLCIATALFLEKECGGWIDPCL